MVFVNENYRVKLFKKDGFVEPLVRGLWFMGFSLENCGSQGLKPAKPGRALEQVQTTNFSVNNERIVHPIPLVFVQKLRKFHIVILFAAIRFATCFFSTPRKTRRTSGRPWSGPLTALTKARSAVPSDRPKNAAGRSSALFNMGRP
jgi:hypothetical protein